MAPEAAISRFPVPSDLMVAPPRSIVSAATYTVCHLLVELPSWKTPFWLGIRLPAISIPGVESSVDIVVPAILKPSITTLPLLEFSVRSALLGDAIVEPTKERSPTDTLEISLSIYAFIDCCVASAVAEFVDKLSSSRIVVTPAPEPTWKVSFIITEPVPDVCKVISAFEGADKVDPTALRSPKLEEDPPPPTSVPPAVTPSPILRLPVSTSTARYPSSMTCVARL